MMERNSDIDFVITWVDGADPQWLEEFRKWRGDDRTENTSPIRYRDWDHLRYWFRGVERFAPWVSRIHFVTWGHLPEWLDTTHPKLHVTNHRDYIPQEYLPTFSSRTIELNIHRIEGLSERFVYFNDDMFLCRPLPEERFFRQGLPCDMARLSLLSFSSISHAILNMIEIMNRRYRRAEVMRRHPGKWFAPCYGAANLLKTLDLAVWNTIPALTDTHMPQPYLKETFDKMWHEEREILDATCRSRVRDNAGVNHWLMRYEQLLSGRFSPVSFRDTKLDTLTEQRIDTIASYVAAGRYAMICLNDSPLIADFEGVKRKLCGALESLLPEKSSYEH